MSKKSKNNSIENAQQLKWYEHIRKRPGMYIGQVNEKGFTELLKGIFSSAIHNTESNKFSIELKENSSAKFSLNNVQKEIANNWEYYTRNPTNPFIMDLFALNALSKEFLIRFWDSENNIIGEQCFEKGKLLTGEKIESINCSKLEVEFLLDQSIWGVNFAWNKTYLTHQIREFAYLYKRTKFEILYKQEDEDCKIVYHFKKGLKDRIDIEILNGLGKSYFATEIDEKIEGFHIEAAFAFREYSVDPPYLKSYVNDFFTFENGTHVDGFLKGLTYGVMKYFQKHELTETYKISEKGIKENLVAAVNIKLDAPVFSGCVKNKLANPEIIEPIANYIADILYKRIEQDESSTKKLIRKFEI